MNDGRTFPQLASEFPDYPAADLPAIPADWVDISWHNDACPSFEAPNGARVFVDYLASEMREHADQLPRFVAMTPDTSEGNGEEIAAGDDWPAIVAAVAAYVNPCQHRDTGRGVCAHCGKFL